MNAVLKEVEVQPETLLTRYATEVEFAAVDAWKAAISEADSRERQIQGVVNDNNRKIIALKNTSWNSQARAAARALGEDVPAVTGPSLAELEDLDRGLQVRLTAAREEVAKLKGKHRGAYMDLLALCAHRCMVDFERLTAEQGWCHQQIAAAQHVIGEGHALISFPIWNRYFVPGSHSQELLGKCREEYGVPVLMSPDRLSLTFDNAVRRLIF